MILTPLFAKIAAGIAVALGIVAGLALWRYDAALTREAAVRANLATALEANASLMDERKRALAETERNRQISATALRRVQQIDEKMGRLKERVLRGDACAIDPADARALDELFN